MIDMAILKKLKDDLELDAPQQSCGASNSLKNFPPPLMGED
jgi:hypothetical protein